MDERDFDAAFSSAILFGCESWIGVSLEPVEKIHVGCTEPAQCKGEYT